MICFSRLWFYRHHYYPPHGFQCSQWQCDRSSDRSFLLHCDPSEADYLKKMYWDLNLSIGCWLDGGRSECELMEKSRIHHQREVCRCWNHLFQNSPRVYSVPSFTFSLILTLMVWHISQIRRSTGNVISNVQSSAFHDKWVAKFKKN